MIARRTLICRVTLGLLAAPLAVEAQPAPKPARVALVCGARCEGGGYDAFRQGLRELGRVEGRNLVVDVRGAEGRPDRLPALVAELVAGRPDIIVAVAPQPALAAKDAAGAIPVVFVGVADPIAIGLVPSLGRPGGNVTGLSTLVPGGFTGKMLHLLKEAVPPASRIAVLWSSKNPRHVDLIPKELIPSAEALGVRLQMLDVTEPGGIAPAVEEERGEATLAPSGTARPPRGSRPRDITCHSQTPATPGANGTAILRRRPPQEPTAQRT